MRKLVLTLVAAVAVSLTGCGPTTTEVTDTGSVTTVDATTFVRKIEHPGVTVVDVRTPAEFDTAHVVGAVNADVAGADFAAQVAGLDKEAPVAVYCQSGRRSLIAAEQLSAAGFVTVTNLAGGIADLRAAGARTT